MRLGLIEIAIGVASSWGNLFFGSSDARPFAASGDAGGRVIGKAGLRFGV
jgi:hypothetical protein